MPEQKPEIRPNGKSLIELLPKIVAEGKREAEQILERFTHPTRITLQTNELVLPAKILADYGKVKCRRYQIQPVILNPL